ncbi:hypothetical protein I7I48_08423 [Histoplasma ohiense]|nr:hypothetical protein I7I48_08423 [Histoplasma ohiense (nom. inval.)]
MAALSGAKVTGKNTSPQYYAGRTLMAGHSATPPRAQLWVVGVLWVRVMAITRVAPMLRPQLMALSYRVRSRGAKASGRPPKRSCCGDGGMRNGRAAQMKTCAHTAMRNLRK